METSKLIAKLRKIVKDHGDFEVDIDVRVFYNGNAPDLWFFGKGWSANGFQANPQRIDPQLTQEPNKVVPIKEYTAAYTPEARYYIHESYINRLESAADRISAESNTDNLGAAIVMWSCLVLVVGIVIGRCLAFVI